MNPYLADAEDSRMAEFEDLVRRTHDAGMKVIGPQFGKSGRQINRNVNGFSVFREHGLCKSDKRKQQCCENKTGFFHLLAIYAGKNTKNVAIIHMKILKVVIVF